MSEDGYALPEQAHTHVTDDGRVAIEFLNDDIQDIILTPDGAKNLGGSLASLSHEARQV